MEKYSIINFKNLDWYVIDIDEINGTTRLLLKDVLDEERIKKYVDDEWYRNGSYVRHTYDVRPPFNWDNSYIKNVVLPNFIKDLGIECEATLLTKEEVESLPDDIRRCNNWWWTRTNASDETDKYAYAFGVSDGGSVSVGGDVSNDYGSLRPAVVCSSAIFESKKDGGKNPFANLEEIPRETINCASFTSADEVLGNKINEIIKALKEQQ